MTTGFVERDKGKTVISTQYQSQGGQFYASASDGLTATGTTQATSLQLINSINRVTTTAANSGVRLPVSVPGASITVINAAAVNSLTVYGFGTDTINASATATGVQVPGRATGTVANFFCTVAGAWHMLLST